MLQNQWVLFKPILGYADNFDIVVPKTNLDITVEIVIELRNPLNGSLFVSIVFPQIILLYEEINIQYRKKTIQALEAIHGKDFYKQGIFEVVNSSDARELSRQSQEINKEKDLRHVVFVTQKTVVEVIMWCYTDRPTIVYAE